MSTFRNYSEPTHIGQENRQQFAGLADRSVENWNHKLRVIKAICGTMKGNQYMSLSCTELVETGSAGRRPGQGRRWATTPNEDRFLVLTARRHRNMNATLLQQHLSSATGTTVSTQTVETGSMV
ncbi:transposable element Tcb2 transposase [Trichonephila clavipes]|nr:transposable element Tcb2 transposase [Trichonephila clavipes]